MFRILDGRDCFYQWDIDRQLLINEGSIKEVHFATYGSEMAIVREAYFKNGERVVDVPNTLLQQSHRLVVYAYDVNYTKYEAEFTVKARQKPDDYVYTETEIEKWSELDARIDQIEDKGVSDEKISSAVNDYLAANPIEVPVESVNGKTGAVELTAADVGALPASTVIPDTTGLATEKYVDEKFSSIEIPDTTGLATEKYVDEKFNSIEIPEVDLTGYATEKYVQDAIANIDIPEGEINVDLSNYYNKSEVDAKIDAIELTPGPQGPAGQDGYTPVKGVDYFDGAPGADGKDGEDYVLTEDDKAEIAALVDVPDVSAFQTEEQVIALIEQYASGEPLPAAEGVEF